MRISYKGLNIIKQYEGFSSRPYLDPVNIPTIGYGMTFYPDSRIKVTMKDKPITLQEGEWYLKLMCITFEKAVHRLVKKPINQNQFDALVSFVYNVGEGAFASSTLLRLINDNPNNPEIEKQFLRWVYAGGKKLPGLVKRRQAESDLYFDNKIIGNLVHKLN